MANPVPCGCAICSLHLEFEFDPHLVSEIERHNCVVFAGSGISTEGKYTHPDTLYETLKHEAGVSEDLDFWDLVDRFEVQPNGRQKLIEIIRDRFDYINGFRELRQTATRFHHSLGNAPYLGAIITTNWDRYFEDVLGATPFVYDSDIPFWESAKRPVLKIHGSIDNYSSIVASTEDYEKCEERLREGALGAVLKQIFATKTCIFCGYSARDKDFRRIFTTIQTGLGQFARTHYLVSPFVTEDEAHDLKANFGILTVRTDASHFVDVVKIHMQEKFCFSSDESFAQVSDELVEFREMHEDFVRSFDAKTSPHLVYSAAYQDGVIHAFERILDRAPSGEFADLHAVQGRIAGYAQKIRECVAAKNYWDAAYFAGYQNGLLNFVLLNDDDLSEMPEIPECYHPGQGELYLEEFDALVRGNPEIHKAALARARKMTERFAQGEQLIPQHLPWG
jgi:hypothetical protein